MRSSQKLFDCFVWFKSEKSTETVSFPTNQGLTGVHGRSYALHKVGNLNFHLIDFLLLYIKAHYFVSLCWTRYLPATVLILYLSCSRISGIFAQGYTGVIPIIKVLITDWKCKIISFSLHSCIDFICIAADKLSYLLWEVLNHHFLLLSFDVSLCCQSIVTSSYCFKL